MAIKFDKVEPGMVLLDIHSHRVGNTTMRELGCWKVRVISVDRANRTALCSWNDNHPKTYYERDFRRLYTKPTKKYREQMERRARHGWWSL